MKILALSSILAFIAIPAHAADICGSLMKCGTYQEGPGEEGELLTITVAQAKGTNQADFSWIYSKNGTEQGGVRLTLSFRENGTFDAVRGDTLYATGICKDFSCTYGLVPYKSKKDGGQINQTGAFEFKGDTLEAAIFYTDTTGAHADKGTLQKKQ